MKLVHKKVIVNIFFNKEVQTNFSEGQTSTNIILIFFANFMDPKVTPAVFAGVTLCIIYVLFINTDAEMLEAKNTVPV